MRDTELLKKLLKDGWEEVRVKGSHHILKKDGKTEVIAVHHKEIATGTEKAIKKRTGLK